MAERAVYDLRGFGRCERCNAPYLMDGKAIYGWCEDPECDGEVLSLGDLVHRRDAAAKICPDCGEPLNEPGRPGRAGGPPVPPKIHGHLGYRHRCKAEARP